MSLLTWGLAITLSSAASGVTTYFMGLRKWRLECQKLKLEIQEKEQEIRKKEFNLQAEIAAHVIWTGIHYAGVSWDSADNCYRRIPSLEMPRWGILLEIANRVKTEKPAVSAGKVKAQIAFSFSRRGSELLAAPAAWIDEPLGMVELAPGDTRWLILAVGFHYTQDWRVPLNRRTESPKPASFDHYDIPGLLGNNGTAKVELISMETNQIVAVFSLGWVWDVGGPLRVVNFAQISN